MRLAIRRSPQSVYLNRFLAGNERLYLGGNFGDGGNNWGVSSVSDGNIGQFLRPKRALKQQEWFRRGGQGDGEVKGKCVRSQRGINCFTGVGETAIVFETKTAIKQHCFVISLPTKLLHSQLRNL